MIIAGVQMACGLNKNENIDKAIHFAEEAIKSGAKMVCFQELFSTIFFPSTVDEDFFDYAETLDGSTISTMKKIAKDRKIWFVPTIFEKSPVITGQFFNSAIVISDKGEIKGLFRKLHIPMRRRNSEKFYFTPGDIIPSPIEVEDLKIGIVICYDRHFPEPTRLLAMKGAHFIVVPTSSKEAPGRTDTWIPEMVTRAIENVFFVVGINRCGTEGDYQYFGHSVIVNPSGQPISSLGDEEGIVIAEITKKDVELNRRKYPHLRDIRYDLYREIMEVFNNSRKINDRLIPFE